MGKAYEQEREALAKIEEILKDFDPMDTYIGKAFEGCVEQAEENINNDWMQSWKDRYDRMSEHFHSANDRLVDVTRQLNQKDDAIARLEDAKNQLSKELDEVKAAHTTLDFKLARAKETADGLKQTILELKAKLYDMMTREEGEE